MELPSAVKLSNAIFPTFVILLSLNDVAPNDIVPVAVKLLEPTSMFPNPELILPASNAPVVTIEELPATTP